MENKLEILKSQMEEDIKEARIAVQDISGLLLEWDEDDASYQDALELNRHSDMIEEDLYNLLECIRNL